MSHEMHSNNKLSMILAMAKNGTIGDKGKVPWKISEDMKHFKKITSYHAVIMGRKTFEDIGKPLSNRHNIIISRQKDLKIDGVYVVNSFDEALKVARLSDDEPIVIGGAEIYRMALPLVNKIYLTEVPIDVVGDIKFEFNRNEFAETNYFSKEINNCIVEEINFITLERK